MQTFEIFVAIDFENYSVSARRRGEEIAQSCHFHWFFI